MVKLENKSVFENVKSTHLIKTRAFVIIFYNIPSYNWDLIGYECFSSLDSASLIVSLISLVLSFVQRRRGYRHRKHIDVTLSLKHYVLLNAYLMQE